MRKCAQSVSAALRCRLRCLLPPRTPPPSLAAGSTDSPAAATAKSAAPAAKMARRSPAAAATARASPPPPSTKAGQAGRARGFQLEQQIYSIVAPSRPAEDATLPEGVTNYGQLAMASDAPRFERGAANIADVSPQRIHPTRLFFPNQMYSPSVSAAPHPANHTRACPARTHSAAATLHVAAKRTACQQFPPFICRVVWWHPFLTQLLASSSPHHCFACTTTNRPLHHAGA
jgi:hypothetical protein